MDIASFGLGVGAYIKIVYIYINVYPSYFINQGSIMSSHFIRNGLKFPVPPTHVCVFSSIQECPVYAYRACLLCNLQKCTYFQ